MPPEAEQPTETIPQSNRFPILSGLKSALTRFKNAGEIALILFGIPAAVWGVIVFFDNRIRDIVTDPSTLRQVAILSRPEMIIEGTGTISVDNGAMEYIADIKMVPDATSSSGRLKKIIITPKRFMKIPPLVTVIDGGFYNITAKRGQKLDWEIDLDHASQVGGPKGQKIRLEIMDL